MNILEKHEKLAALCLILLFFAAISLIAVGLWLLSHAFALIFMGMTALYLGVCLNRVIQQERKMLNENQ